jgi:hypothetical protein
MCKIRSILKNCYIFIKLIGEVTPLNLTSLKPKMMKNLLLSASALLLSVSAMAQLFVRPNPTNTTDSYIYVSDIELFVDGEVYLEKNAAGSTEASIYLRNDAQFFQGSETNINKGDGHLSVYQDNFGDTYDYTFWSSPVGIADDLVTGDTNFGIDRLYDVVDVTDSNQSTNNSGYNGLAPMNISTRWTYMHPAGNVSAPSYVRIYDNDIVPSGYGFLMRGIGVGNTTQNYDFRGRPNNGTLLVAVETGKYTLSGNPYPSALDLKALYYDTDNIESVSGNYYIDSFRYWDEDKDVDHYNYNGKLGGFGIWVPGGNTPGTNDGGLYTVAPFASYDESGTFGTTVTSGAHYERRYAPIGQGFMIYGQEDGNVSIKNSHRVFVKEGAANLSEFRSSSFNSSMTGLFDPNATYNDDGTVNEDPTVTNTVSPMLRINVDFEEKYARQLLLAFDESTSEAYDAGWDATSALDQIATAEAYFPIDRDGDKVPHVIQARNFTNDVRVPLSIILKSELKFEIKAVEEINLDQLRPNLAAFVHDTETNTYKKITDDEGAVYQLPTGDYLDRFYIVFAMSRQSLEEEASGVVSQLEIQKNVDFFQNNRASQLEVSNPEGYDIATANIYDLNGKLVISERNLGDSTRLTFPTGNLSDGVYIVKLMTTDNVAIDYKMTVYNNK